MIPGCIRGANVRLGPPQNMADCSPLMVLRSEWAGGAITHTSAWFPTPHELALLNSGNAVYLSVFGVGHPPVALSVGEAE